MDTTILLVSFMFTTTLAFIVLVWKTDLGVTKSIIVTLLLMKVWIGVFYLMDVDREFFIVETRIGSFTVTAMMILFVSTLIANVYLIARMENLRRILG